MDSYVISILELIQILGRANSPANYVLLRAFPNMVHFQTGKFSDPDRCTKFFQKIHLLR